jgi:hypothetical protein
MELEKLINVLIFLMAVNITINMWMIFVIRKAYIKGVDDGVRIGVTAMVNGIHASAVQNNDSRKNPTS